MYVKQTYHSPLGTLQLLGTEDKLVGAWFEDQPYFAQGFSLAQIKWGKTKTLVAASQWLDEYFSGQIPTTKLILSPEVTPFRQQVLQELQQIPYGTTLTYRDLALQLASHPRAIGGAVAHNPLLIFIPCHRILASDGSLHGYAGGVARKKALLELEQKSGSKEVGKKS